MRIPESYRLEEGQSLDLERGVPKELRLQRVTVIRGRALLPDGAPAPWVSYDCERTRYEENFKEVGRGGGRTRGDGTFEIAVPHKLVEARITLSDGENVGRLVLGKDDLWPIEAWHGPPPAVLLPASLKLPLKKKFTLKKDQ